MNLTNSIQRDGYCPVPRAIASDAVRDLITAIECAAAARQQPAGIYAIRNLFSVVPAIAKLARSPAVRTLVEPVLGPACFPVRALLFDKLPEANWHVPWHQDCSIAVRRRIEIEGFSSWTVKAGVPHVQPPTSVLEQMVTVRIHLDTCGIENGPLRVLRGTHRHGRLSAEQIETELLSVHQEVLTAQPGDALLMRPLLVHASSSATSPLHRRVVHLEFASCQLPGGIEWHLDG